MIKQIKVWIMVLLIIGLLMGCTRQSEQNSTNTGVQNNTFDSNTTLDESKSEAIATPETTYKNVSEEDIPFVESGTFTGGNNETLEFAGEKVTIINSDDRIIITIPAFGTFDGVHAEANDAFPYTVKAFEYPKYLLLTIKSYELYAPYQNISTQHLTMEEYPEGEFGWDSYMISSKEDIEFRVYDEKNPGRVIIEIRKANEKEKHGTVFSVRSENADRGYYEGAWFADVPSSLRREHGLEPRILKTETGECIEATYFKNKEEAEQLLAEINNYVFEFYIEERGMFDIPEDYSTEVKEEYIPTMTKEEIINYVKSDVVDVFRGMGMKLGLCHLYIQDFNIEQQTIYAVIERDTPKEHYFLYNVTFSNNDYPTVSHGQTHETDSERIQFAEEIKKSDIKFDAVID